MVTATLTIQNSIVAGNTDLTGNIFSPDCSANPGQIISTNYNLVGNNQRCNWPAAINDQVGVDPLLDALADNGGETLTHALLAGSPALDAGNPAGCTDHLANPLTTDQRGLARLVDGDNNGSAICDSGAFEAGADVLAVTKSGPGGALMGWPVTYAITVINHDVIVNAGVVLTDALPAGVSFVSGSPGCSPAAGQNVRCNLQSLNPNESVEVTITATPNVTGTIINTVTASGGRPDSFLANNTASAATVVTEVRAIIYLPIVSKTP